MSHSILMIEDSFEDYETVARLVRRSGFQVPIALKETGDEALAHLRQTTDLPTLILLDLNLPGEDGHDILQILKKDPALNIIPVIVLTTSNSQKDVYRCYHHGANSYLVKPVDLPYFESTLKTLLDYWLTLVELPRYAAG